MHVTLSLVGVLPPLGVYDPLGLIETRDMRRYEIMVRSELWIYSKSILNTYRQVSLNMMYYCLTNA